MMRRPAVILVVLLTLGYVCAVASEDGGTESVFNLGAGARAMGMGNGFVALADDATAVYYNPAAMPYLQSQQISLLHTVLFEGTTYDYVSYVYPGGSLGGFGVAGMRLGTDDIGRRDEVTDLGKFSASQVRMLIAYGRSFGGRLSAGASLKLAHQSIDNYSAYGYGLDFGGQMRLNENLRAGILLQDAIGPRLELGSADERTPFNIKTGVACLVKPNSRSLSAAVTFDLDKPEKRSFKVRTGLELIHSSGLILRSGYDRDNFTLGLGIYYQDLTFDYAYKFIDRLSDSHRFSLTFNFGATQEEKAARRADAERANSRRMLTESRKASLAAELEKAEKYYAEGQLDLALAAYYRADAFAEDKTVIRSRIDVVKRMIEADRVREPVIIVTDSGTVGVMADLESQAGALFERRALVAARDMAALARQYQGATHDLEILENAIDAAIAREISTNLIKAENAFNQGDYIAAYDSYNTVLMYEPNNKRARGGSRSSEKLLNLAQHLNLALNYFNQGKYISSQREFSAALELDPGNKTAVEYSARIGEMIKKSTTLEDLQRDSRIWQLYLNGLEAFRKGDYEKAIEYWEDVLEVYPNNRNTIENIEQAKLRLNK
jgi:tetratricopeptide (TPR) repeat protein